MQKNAGQFENFFGSAKRFVLASEGLDALSLLAGDAFSYTGVDLTFLIQSCKLWGTPPILADMDSIAAHRERYSPQRSCTMRTVRLRTSGERLGDFFMVPFS